MGKTEVREVQTNERDEDGDIGAFEYQEVPALITMTGYVSTSLDKNAAEQFAWSNSESDIESTLFKILFKDDRGYYVMDMSALP